MEIPVLLLNLDRDSDRLRHMEEEFRRAGLAFERVPGVLGLNLPDWARADFLDEAGQIASRLKPGEVGCYASHLSAMRIVVERGLPFALIAEDDLLVPGDSRAVLAEAIAALPAHWDLVRLSNLLKEPYRVMATLNDGRHLALYARVPNNAGAYLVSLEGARKILAPRRRIMPIDELLKRPWILNLETYGLVPMLMRSNIFDSSIDSLGDRGLGRETFFQKLRRRQWPGPVGLFRQWSWQIRHLGLAGYAKAIGLHIAHSLAKKLSPPLAARIRAAFAMRGR